MSEIAIEDKIKRVCIAMLRATRPSQDPERLTPAPRGQLGLIPLWELYRPLGEAACKIFHDEENKRIAALEAESKQRKEIIVDVISSLAAALSILQRANSIKKQPSRVVPSNSMFAQMMIDYQKSLDRARAALENKED